MKRIGFHYYHDTHHYRQSDLENWLPKLKRLGASWLVLQAPVTRALPEEFLKGLQNAGIDPIIHLDLALDKLSSREDLELLFRVYSRWGIKYVVLFKEPNLQSNWGGAAWAQNDLVERFLDMYLPIAQTCLQYQLTPIFPPLQPGGDYWDTAFLREALESLQRRGHHGLLEKLVIGANAWIGDRPLDWGMGGPERWPGASPYSTPPGEQDQRGLRIFDWYETIARSVLREPLPIFLFGLGAPIDESYPQKMLKVAKLMEGHQIEGMDPISNAVLGGAFRLFDAVRGNEFPIIEAIQNVQKSNPIEASSNPKIDPTIAHYLLLPSYEWGIPDYHLDAIRPFIRNHQPTVGFSLQEAAQAKRVTVIGSDEDYTEKELRELRTKGCIVERVEAYGTTLASHLDKLLEK